nr:acidic leucine-rich nuclear phosphoprotein 32 family member E-like [Malus domestica]
MTGSTFNLRGAVMWTINDFLAYENLSGLSTHDTRGKKFIQDYHLTSVNKVVQKIQHRHVWDVPEKDDDSVDHDNDEDDDDYVDENEIFMRPIPNEDDEVNIELSRDDVDSEFFDANDKEVQRMLGLENEGEGEEEEEEEEEEEVATCDTDSD